MKTARVILVCLLALLVLSSVASADDDIQLKPFQVGLGSSFGMQLTITGGGDLFSSGPVRLLIPMIIAKSFRVEPEFGWVHSGASNDSADYKSNTDYVRFGVGGGYLMMIGDTALVFGLRLGLDYGVSKETDSKKDDRTNFYLGPFAGAEHFFGPNFSLGMEVQFQYYDYGKDNGIDTYTLSTSAQILARMYF